MTIWRCPIFPVCPGSLSQSFAFSLVFVSVQLNRVSRPPRIQYALGKVRLSGQNLMENSGLAPLHGLQVYTPVRCADLLVVPKATGVSLLLVSL